MTELTWSVLCVSLFRCGRSLTVTAPDERRARQAIRAEHWKVWSMERDRVIHACCHWCADVFRDAQQSPRTGKRRTVGRAGAESD